MYKHLLIPTDGSPRSERAIKAAIATARALGARVTGLFVAPAPTPLVYDGLIPVGYMSPEDHEELIRKTATRNLSVIEKAAAAAKVTCECLTITSDFPAESIVETAKKHKCDLIFMASHGRSGELGPLIGSETQKVLAGTAIPVLVHR